MGALPATRERRRPLDSAGVATIRDRARMSADPGWLPSSMPLYARMAFEDREDLLAHADRLAAAIEHALRHVRIASGECFGCGSGRGSEHAEDCPLGPAQEALVAHGGTA